MQPIQPYRHEGNLPSGQTVQYAGPVQIRGNVESGGLIIATGDIEIQGDVMNARVKSSGGSVTVRGVVKGVTTQVYAMQDVNARMVYNATIKSGRDIRVHDIAVDAHLVARNTVQLDKDDGVIEGGEIEAGVDILSGVVGNSHEATTVVKLTNFRQSELYNRLAALQREIMEATRQMSELEKYIEVIRILGNKVISLPPEKKQDLALRVKRYNEFKAKIAELEREAARIQEQNANEDELDRTIIVRKEIHPGVYVYIDRAKLLVQERFKRVILYKKGIIIIGDYDEFMKRKKYF
jgi:hypothetical protein